MSEWAETRVTAEFHRAEIERRHATLTERERQILAQVVLGRLNKQIADELGVSTRTVETHRAHIIEKMGATSLSHLVRMAVAMTGSI